MEQQQCHNKVFMDQADMCDSLSFSGLVCVPQQTKSAEPHISMENNGYGSAINSDPDFKFNSSSKHQLIKPVSYNNLAVLLPHCESSRGGATSPKKYDGGGGKKGVKGGRRVEADVTKKRKKSVFRSIFEPCRVCNAVEPSAIKEQNPLAARKQS